MGDLGDLYQELILDHNARPHNFGVLTDATHQADGYNPLCGDQVTIYLIVDPTNCITDVRFAGKGCAISKASASLMTDHLKGKSVHEAELLFARFHRLVTDANTNADDTADLGKLLAFAGVREYPMRVKCATLAWHTLQAAIKKQRDVISTEGEL